MTEQPRPADIGRLHAELAAQRARIARLERRRLRPGRALPLLLAALLAALVPLATLAANPFTDLVPGSVHNADIGAIYAAGITTGCDPNVAYCPNNFVTREEMASFLARAAGLGGNPPVANALTAQTAANAASATSATTALTAVSAQTAAQAGFAAEADKLDGRGANELLRVGAAQAGGSVPVVANTLATVATVDIAAPAAGYVLVTGAMDLYHDANACPCEVQFSLAEVGNGNPTGRIQSATLPAPALANNFHPVAVQYVFTVAGPGTRTFALRALKTGGAGQLSAVHQTLTAVYVPFNRAGAATGPP